MQLDQESRTVCLSRTRSEAVANTWADATTQRRPSCWAHFLAGVGSDRKGIGKEK
jgi:hypothetical protein